jgi:hypothetical protein
MIRLTDPPRDVPIGLRLKILAHRDVTGSAIYFLPAAAALVAGTAFPGTAPRILLLVVGSFFLFLGLWTALPALVRGIATLGRMRMGFVTMGRIVSCHLAWDGKSKEMPYGQFLEDWVVNISRSQMGKAIGCFTMIVATVFGLPLLLITLVAVIAYVASLLGSAGGTAMAGELDGQDLAKFVGMGLVFFGLVFLFLRFWRKKTVDAVVPYLEWRRLAKPGPNDVYDEHAMRLVALAREQGAQVSLKAPLPENYSAIELVCQVEYAAMGEPCTATGRVRFSNRLDPAGVERVLFNNLERGKVDLFAGLPDEVHIDEQGRWSDVPPYGSALLLALSGGAAAVAIAALLRISFLLQATFSQAPLLLG